MSQYSSPETGNPPASRSGTVVIGVDLEMSVLVTSSRRLCHRLDSLPSFVITTLSLQEIWRIEPPWKTSTKTIELDAQHSNDRIDTIIPDVDPS